MIPPEAVVSFLRLYNSFALVGHEEPDGDCVGSQLALAAALGRIGKSVTLCNPGPFDRREIRHLADKFVSDPAAIKASSIDATIVVDCSSADRLAAFSDTLTALPVAVVDHHTSGTPFGNVHYIDPNTPATTLLVYSLIESLGLRVSKPEAEFLFFGLATDTGFFRFLGSEQWSALETASRLVQAGASPRTTYDSMFHHRSRESREYLARALTRVDYLATGRAALTYLTAEDTLALGAKNRDSDAVHTALLAVDSVEILAVVRELPDKGSCTVSFRATGEIDVGQIAAEFGGGGHQKAAGCALDLPLHDALRAVRTRLEEATRQ